MVAKLSRNLTVVVLTVSEVPHIAYGELVVFTLITDRLRLRHWRETDANAALAIYGVADPTGWHTPITHKTGDYPAMRSVLTTWAENQPRLPAPQGRWAIERRHDGTVVGGLAIRPLPPDHEDLEISFQLAPAEWGQGYAVESAHALLNWALTQDVDELFGVVPSHNRQAIKTMKRLGMQWVGETSKYYDNHTLLVYRIRLGELKTPEIS
jgi:RimJ/RimL family protein N-acetyltransferase